MNFITFSLCNLLTEGSELSYLYLPEVLPLVDEEVPKIILEACAGLLKNGVRYSKFDVMNALNLAYGTDQSLIKELQNYVDPTVNVGWEQYPDYLNYLKKERNKKKFKMSILDLADKFINDLIAEEETADMMSDILQDYYQGVVLNYRSLDRAQLDRIEQLELKKLAGEDITGTSSGFAGIDKSVGYLQQGNIVIIAGRPSVGKTGWLLSSLLNKLDNLNPEREFIYFVEGEMLEEEMIDRINSILVKINAQKFRFPSKIEDFVFEGVRNKLQPGCFLESNLLPPKQLQTQIKNLEFQTRKKCVAVYYDYIQLLTTDREKLATYSVEFKGVAKALKLPIIIASQLNRDADVRATLAKNKLSDEARPSMENLAACGQIEMDADLAMALYKPAKYDTSISKSYIELVTIKGRHTAESLFYFEMDKYQKFVQIDEARRAVLLKQQDPKPAPNIFRSK
jgi:replicative DNA helicase